MEEEIKRKRGRPRKVPVPEVPKRPRGRPRKITAGTPAAQPPVVTVNTPRKQAKVYTVAPVRLGVEYCSEALKIGRNGDPAITRNAKYIDGKLVSEMIFDYKKDEANYKFKELA